MNDLNVLLGDLALRALNSVFTFSLVYHTSFHVTDGKKYTFDFIKTLNPP